MGTGTVGLVTGACLAGFERLPGMPVRDDPEEVAAGMTHVVAGRGRPGAKRRGSAR
ncbi:MAG TPA: hypothetical protein VI792_10315 [Candidatus Eisenbacteria bacterium]